MKKTTVTISYDEEKVKALRLYLELKGCKLEDELTKIIETLYDKFGEDTKMIRLDSDSCVATIKVQVSPTFWGWIFQFGKQMRIISPVEMIKEYRNKAAMLIE